MFAEFFRNIAEHTHTHTEKERTINYVFVYYLCDFLKIFTFN